MPKLLLRHMTVMKYVFSYKGISMNGRDASLKQLWENEADLCISKQLKGRACWIRNSNTSIHREKTSKTIANSLWKHAYSNILKILPQKKKWKFSGEKFWYFSFLFKDIDCWYSLELPHWGSSNEYPQSMFLSRNKKNNVYHCKPQFYCIKLGFKEVKII